MILTELKLLVFLGLLWGGLIGIAVGGSYIYRERWILAFVCCAIGLGCCLLGGLIWQFG